MGGDNDAAAQALKQLEVCLFSPQSETRKRGRKVRTQETAEIRNCGSPMTKKARQHSSKEPDGLVYIDQGWGGVVGGTTGHR